MGKNIYERPRDQDKFHICKKNQDNNIRAFEKKSKNIDKLKDRLKKNLKKKNRNK